MWINSARIFMSSLNEFVNRCEPADVIALAIIIGGFILKFNGADGTVTALLTAVSFYYFGNKLAKSKTNYAQNRTVSPGDNGTRGVDVPGQQKLP